MSNDTKISFREVLAMTIGLTLHGWALHWVYWEELDTNQPGAETEAR